MEELGFKLGDRRKLQRAIRKNKSSHASHLEKITVNPTLISQEELDTAYPYHVVMEGSDLDGQSQDTKSAPVAAGMEEVRHVLGALGVNPSIYCVYRFFSY